MRRVLLIAYHFPPFTGSSGVQRALRFACHLPEFGWEPIVLTAHPRAYEKQSDDLLKELPEAVTVIRAPAWDAKRHFSIGGRYPGFLSRPDRWRSWRPGAILAGLRAIEKYKPDAIWSTYPIATAHSIGAALARKSRLPWIADFRDPMAQDGYPSDPATYDSFVNIERETMSRANYATFTTPGAVDMYRERYPSAKARVVLLENGYNEDTFAQIEKGRTQLNPGYFTLLHSGVVYPKERDPRWLFEAFGEMRTRSPTQFARLKLRFRAAGCDDMLRDLTEANGLRDKVELLPMVSHREATQEMCDADGLLVMQADDCNAQIPAKLYDYFRSGTPVLVLSDPEGDTAKTAKSVGISAVCALNEKKAIGNLLGKFIAEPEIGAVSETVRAHEYSRRTRTAKLASWLDELSTVNKL